jgi:hypothetical protein
VFKIAGSDDIAAALEIFAARTGKSKGKKPKSALAWRQLRRKGTFSEASHARKRHAQTQIAACVKYFKPKVDCVTSTDVAAKLGFGINSDESHVSRGDKIE